MSGVSPKAPDPNVRTALIEAAARLLAEGGADAMTTRRIAAEVGTSTMALYTYFSGMEDLRRAMQREGFERLARYLDSVPPMRDPVARVSALGIAYCFNALANPHLYRVMFLQQPVEDDSDIAPSTIQRLIDAVALATEAGRFSPGDPWIRARQLWAMAHGIVTLQLAGILTQEDAIDCMTEAAENFYVAFGDDRKAAVRSLKKAIDQMGLDPLAAAEASA